MLIFVNQFMNAVDIKMENTNDLLIEKATELDYKYGFVTDIEQEFANKGLSEDIVRFISAK